MFGLFRKKTQLEQLIAKDGMEHATARFAEIVSQKLPSREVAYKFILEELDGASQGNEASQAFARNSGISSSAYSGALGNSSPEIDGPDGPQQLLLALSMQLMPNQELMAEFRCRVDDNVMKRFRLGKYASKDERIANLFGDLKNLLLSDDSVVPTLHPDIPAPEGATKRHISRREKNIAAAKELLSTLTNLTGEASRAIVLKAIGSATQDERSKAEIQSAIQKHNYSIKPNGFTVEDAASGDGLAAVIRDGMFHGALSMKGIGTGPLAPWPVDTNPFDDDNHFFGSGMSPQGQWSFSIRPSAPFSQILREAREEYARNA